MKKFLILILLLTGCSSKFYLSDKYYNEGNFVNNYDINDSYLLYTYGTYCIFNKPCDETIQEFMNEYKIDMVKMSFDEFKNTKFYQTVKYAPSVLIIKDGNIVAYLDANKDSDLQRYQNSRKFAIWASDYIYLERQK